MTEKSLNAFYYAYSYAKSDDSWFMNVTASMALKLIPDSLKPQPVFPCIDETMVSKFGQKFEEVSQLFDQATPNGSPYLNGHCFVSIMLCIPVWKNNNCVYLFSNLLYVQDTVEAFHVIIQVLQGPTEEVKIIIHTLQSMMVNFWGQHG